MEIKYELAKELRDAGFPAKGLWVFYGTYDELEIKGSGFDYCLRDDVPAWANTIAAPTLSELIEACGEGLRNLTNFYNAEQNQNMFGTADQVWEAYGIINNPRYDAGVNMKHNCASCNGHGPESPEIRFYKRGTTPEEAVANLWLAIHNK